MADDVSHETPPEREVFEAPDHARQDLADYVKSRFVHLDKAAKKALDLAGSIENRMHLEMMFRDEYWRKRHDLLEANAQALVKRVVAASALLERAYGDEAVRLMEQEIEKVGDIDEIPPL